MQLSIIIVSYNTCKLTLQTIDSVTKSLLKNSPLKNNYEVIVVDNDSHDESVAELKKIQSRQLKEKRENEGVLKIIESKKNAGFGSANNLGFKSATGQYVLFLNSDTIVQKGALEKLVDYYQTHEKDKKPLGFLAAQLLNTDGTWQPQGGDLPNLLTIINTMLFVDDLPIVGKYLPSVQHTGRSFNQQEIDKKAVIKKPWVGGTAFLSSRELYETMTGFDENIFLYGEDQELCYRVVKAGYWNGILTGAHIMHLGSASSSSARAIAGEITGYFYFFYKYKPAGQMIYLKMILWLAMMIRLTVYTLKKDAKRKEVYELATQTVEKQKV